MAAARQLALPLPAACPAIEPPPADDALVLTRLPDRMPAGLLAPRLPPMRQPPLLPLELPTRRFPRLRLLLVRLLDAVIAVLSCWTRAT